jgi:hypothetical protein
VGRLEEAGVGPKTVQGQEVRSKIRASTCEGQEVSLYTSTFPRSYLHFSLLDDTQ